jgi:DNA-binding MarR family transcriptional regulator
MNPYTKFLNLLQGISQLDKFPTMTPLSKLILDQIALHEYQGKLLTVREMIGFEQIASPATLHKHLASLRSSGYVSATSDSNDNRTKHLVLTALGHQYVNNLSQAIIQAAAT